MTPNVGRPAGWLVTWMVSQNFPKGREVTLPCSYCSLCYNLFPKLCYSHFQSNLKVLHFWSSKTISRYFSPCFPNVCQFPNSPSESRFPNDMLGRPDKPYSHTRSHTHTHTHTHTHIHTHTRHTNSFKKPFNQISERQKTKKHRTRARRVVSVVSKKGLQWI